MELITKLIAWVILLTGSHIAFGLVKGQCYDMRVPPKQKTLRHSFGGVFSSLFNGLFVLSSYVFALVFLTYSVAPVLFDAIPLIYQGVKTIYDSVKFALDIIKDIVEGIKDLLNL